ncbi:MAG: ATP-dependent helicase, partial [Acidobacteria bacterium]|nr:ATP-dependent helicase [Acidobacteriota bacterium]
MTLHAAKGLEFPVVFLTGCEEGILPLRFPGEENDEALQEERRLFFVGLTRAESWLFLTHAECRFWRGEVRQQQPSSFLAEIEEALVERQGDSSSAARSSGVRQLSLL